MKYLKIAHKQRNFIFIQLSFLILTIAMTWFELSSNYVIGTDGQYHLQEAQEIAYDLSHHIWPSFTHLYGISGSAVPTFYPWLSFIPLIIGDLIHIPIRYTFCIYIILILDFSFNILFYCTKKYWHSTKIAILSSLLIMITLENTINIDNNDFGSILATPFIFIAIFSWIKWIKHNKWMTLSISMSILIYLHFVSAYETLLTLTLLTLLSIAKLNKEKILNGIKAFMLTVCTTALIWMPILILRFTNNIYFPIGKSMFINDNKSYPIIWIIYPYITMIIFSFIIFKYRKSLPYYSRKICMAILFLVIIQCLPLFITVNSPFITIQYIYRLTNIINVLLIIVLMPLIMKFFSLSKGHKSKVFIIAMLIVQFIMIGWISYQQQSKVAYNNKIQVQAKDVHHNKNHFLRATILRSPNSNIPIKVSQPKLLRNKFFLNEFISHDIINKWLNQLHDKFYIDTPQKSNIISYYPAHILKYNMLQEHMKYIPNGIDINNSKLRYNMRIPIILYHNQKYQFYLNHNKLNHIHYHFHEPVLRTLPKGHYELTYKTPTMPYRYISAIISLVGIIWSYLLYEKQRKYYK